MLRILRNTVLKLLMQFQNLYNKELRRSFPSGNQDDARWHVRHGQNLRLRMPGTGLRPLPHDPPLLRTLRNGLEDDGVDISQQLFCSGSRSPCRTQRSNPNRQRTPLDKAYVRVDTHPCYIPRFPSLNISKASQPPVRLYFLCECDTIERGEGRTNRYIP